MTEPADEQVITPPADVAVDDVAVLRRFIGQLAAALARYEAAGQSDLVARRHEFWLADAALAAQQAAAPGAAPHFAVVGPTQTGKSTLVNAIVGADVVEASPLAGTTVRPHAIGLGVERVMQEDIANWLGLATENASESDVAIDEIEFTPRERLTSSNDAPTPALTLWDTPDFDSVTATTYDELVMRTAGAVDGHIISLSKEKYADLTVWTLLRLLCLMNRPALIVLNKMTAEARETVVDALETRLAALQPRPTRWQVRTLPQVSGEPAAITRALQDHIMPVREWLADTARSTSDAAADQKNKQGVIALLRGCWPAWIAPLQREYAVAAEWATVVDAQLQKFVQHYQEEYLDDPKRYDSFRRATIELLTLLELPGVSRPLARVREVITYPIRAAFGAGREAWRRSGHTPRDNRTNEHAWLQDAIEEVFVRLRRDAARRADADDAAVWAALSRKLEERAPSLTRTFEKALAEHCERSNAEIQRTAQELYDTLKKNPAALQGLRAARATADVAGIALAIKTGGAPMHDLLLAPALLAVTSLLTEGALSGYMRSVAARLKERLLADVRENLVADVLREQFAGIAENLSGRGVFGVRKRALAAAEAALDRWENAT